MNSHLQRRILFHIGKHNTFQSWATAEERLEVAGFVKALPGQRWQLSRNGWEQLGQVVVRVVEERK